MTIEEAIKVLERISEGAIQRDCSTCGRPTAGIYSGVCCYCSLCEVVPEILKDYHERKHFRSYWTWDGKRKNEALEMAISALRQQETVENRNEPLTLDELRKMDETVWVCYPQPTFGTNLLTEHMDCTRYKFSFADYGKTWLAYRQKPEEGTV